MSDKPTAIETDASKGQHFFFGQTAEHGVRARLLDEKAAEILKEAKVGDAVDARCFCQGMDGTRTCCSKSCIRP